MNYLAHLFLAENNAASRIGNLLGDFVVGPATDTNLPRPVVAGVIRHRTIDRFTDEHPAVVKARGFFTGPRRRFANAILDICFDNVLANAWDSLHAEPLRQFLDRFYVEMKRHQGWLPGELSQGLDARIADDWLGHYGTDDGLQQVFDRVVARRPACAAVGTAMIDFTERREDIAETFHTFLPDLHAKLGELGPERVD